MIRTISLKKPEGRYEITYLEKDDANLTTHFTIDCACENISGSWINKPDVSLEEEMKIYQPQTPYAKPFHTFHINAPHLEQWLQESYTRRPLEIGCRSCYHIFSFTKKSYDSLIQEIYNANLLREQNISFKK